MLINDLLKVLVSESFYLWTELILSPFFLFCAKLTGLAPGYSFIFNGQIRDKSGIELLHQRTNNIP